MIISHKYKFIFLLEDAYRGESDIPAAKLELLRLAWQLLVVQVERVLDGPALQVRA